MSTTNSANCEVHSVIRFFKIKIICVAEIHHQFVKVSGEGVMNEGNVSKHDLKPICRHQGFERHG
jgi:hypothetical protein